MQEKRETHGFLGFFNPSRDDGVHAFHRKQTLQFHLHTAEIAAACALRAMLFLFPTIHFTVKQNEKKRVHLSKWQCDRKGMDDECKSKKRSRNRRTCERTSTHMHTLFVCERLQLMNRLQCNCNVIAIYMRSMIVNDNDNHRCYKNWCRCCCCSDGGTVARRSRLWQR